ncbi:MAG: hypothetical protein DRP16_00275 [Candidatus Aenigmatarchaeota archaeon]|nr:MAG: hypothetical protein DRP16_00275 [Candidatus Aenigmarchaeota archaeon]
MKCVIETRKLNKYYGKGTDHEVHALKNIDLKIKEGSFVSIMGPSGSGKTTLLDVIGCLLRPSSGDLWIDGENTNNKTDKELAKIRGKKIGFVFQQYNLIPGFSALENVEIALRINGKNKKQAREKARAVLNLLGLEKRIYHRPAQLSGGEQQRVAIARALANDPKIILADEPTGNLDTKTGEMITRLLRKINKEKNYTIVIVTHDPRIGKHADNIINIIDGKISKEGFYET